MIIRFLGTHNEESSTTGLSSVLIDDILAIDAGSLVSGLSFAEQEKIKAILLSHGHYDHIRDIPAFAFSNSQRLTRVLATEKTLGILISHLLDGLIYPRFASPDSFLKRPVIEPCRLEVLRPQEIEGYRILPLPMNHPLETIGFSITAPDGKNILYFNDTGPGLHEVWRQIDSRPQLLIIDTTYPNRLEQFAWDAGHLCPKMLAGELDAFDKCKGYLPQVVLVHLSPRYEGEIREEVSQTAAELGITIRMAREGDLIII